MDQIAGENTAHVPVLPEAVLAMLRPQAGQVVLDGTVGRGGHAALILPRLGPDGRYIGLDMDPANADFARRRLEPLAAAAGVRLDVIHANFAAARQVLDEHQVPVVDGLLADLGFASSQMDDPQRGLAFSQDGPLDMRLDPTLPTTAADLVNTLDERELADVIYHYGEERLSRKIARKIAAARQESPILTTTALAELVRSAYGPPRTRQARHRGRGRARHGTRIDPATRTFMALRIAVNGELDALTRLLDDLPRLMRTDGRAVLISFHSLEDRRVKQAFARYDAQGLGSRLTRKPLTADADEQQANPRSRSAKLRALKWGGIERAGASGRLGNASEAG